MRCFYTRWSDGLWEKEQQEVTVSQLGGLRKTWGKSWEPLMHGTEFDFEDSLRNSCKGRRGSCSLLYQVPQQYLHNSKFTSSHRPGRPLSLQPVGVSKP